MGPKTSTALIRAQQSKMLRMWAITGARSLSGTLLKHHTRAQAKGEGSIVVMQVIVAPLAVCALKTVQDVPSTATSALASVPTKQQAQTIPR
jgi:hypothetical protein